SLNPLYFLGGAILVLLIVLGVVVLNCLRIARANPVESLKKNNFFLAPLKNKLHTGVFGIFCKTVY
ncbi:MAG: hypothetical protein II103_07530, partial [Treponema sp.]|nr:hypothetical protein [Treponema sp.]